jgi:hypothetical protein
MYWWRFMSPFGRLNRGGGGISSSGGGGGIRSVPEEDSPRDRENSMAGLGRALSKRWSALGKVGIERVLIDSLKLATFFVNMA